MSLDRDEKSILKFFATGGCIMLVIALVIIAAVLGGIYLILQAVL